MQAGRGPGRSTEGWRVGGREQGEDGGGREGSRGGRDVGSDEARQEESVSRGREG